MTKQTDTSKEAVESVCRNIHDAVNRNKLPAYSLVWVDLLRALVAERNEWKARAERAEGALKAWVELAVEDARATLAQTDAEALKEAERLAVIALNTGCATQADAEQLRAAVNAYCKARKGGDT